MVECIYLLLFLVTLPCLLSSYMFTLSLVFPQATQKYLFFRHNLVRYVIFLQKQTIAHISHPFAIPRISQDALVVLLWTVKSLLVLHSWLWLQLLSLGFILSFAGFLIGIWILCILLCTNLVILHELLSSVSFSSWCCFYHITSCYLNNLFQICSVLLLKYFTSWHNSKVGNFGVFPWWIIHSPNMSSLPLICWDFLFS